MDANTLFKLLGGILMHFPDNTLAYKIGAFIAHLGSIPGAFTQPQS